MIGVARSNDGSGNFHTVEDASKVQTARVVPPHGTRARYVHRSVACHCDECKRANARYIQRYRNGVWAPTRFTEMRLPGT